MSCADVCIDMDWGDAEHNEFFREGSQRARKSHVCCECKGPIVVGATYWYASGKANGEERMWTAKTCAECYDIRLALVCGRWIYGCLWEEIHDNVFPYWNETSPIDCLAKVESLDARNKLRTEYARYLKERT